MIEKGGSYLHVGGSMKIAGVQASSSNTRGALIWVGARKRTDGDYKRFKPSMIARRQRSLRTTEETGRKEVYIHARLNPWEEKEPIREGIGERGSA